MSRSKKKPKTFQIECSVNESSELLGRVRVTSWYDDDGDVHRDDNHPAVVSHSWREWWVHNEYLYDEDDIMMEGILSNKEKKTSE